MSKKEKKATVDILEDEALDEKEDKVLEDETDEAIEESNEVDELKKEIEKLQNEKNEFNTKYLLALAESQNYKKRMDDEQAKFIKYSTFNLCKEIVKSLDNLDLALDKKYSEEMESYLSGFRMVRNSLYSILEKEGVKEYECLGKDFDPNYMTSLSVTNDKSKKDNEVVLVYQKCYMFKDRVLRPAMVVVNQVEEETQEENKEDNN
ncbi:MAG: nucleotide exchange factor GrpE [Gammaproteobacteria bacterium]|nr:nucleotide exchange factor GrpE [Gammaproteobacteria bacterium]